MNKKLVKSLLNEALELNSDLFLVEFNIDDNSHISIIIDGDNGVNVSECIRISRNIENNIDRDENDFSLEVASFDISKPLVLTRQYKKNIGRKLKVKTKENGKFEGNLISISEKEDLTLQWKERVPKVIGKGKMTVEKEEKINIADIIEAKVVLIF